MIEGWHGENYLILFDEAEVASASDRYAISQCLPGYEVIGLRGWDNFIVRNSVGEAYSVPTVPVVPEHLWPFSLPAETSGLRADERFSGKIKWYAKPIVFGGDPSLGENVIWVSHEEHTQLVRYWNTLYRWVKGQPTTPGSRR